LFSFSSVFKNPLAGPPPPNFFFLFFRLYFAFLIVLPFQTPSAATHRPMSILVLFFAFPSFLMRQINERLKEVLAPKDPLTLFGQNLKHGSNRLFFCNRAFYASLPLANNSPYSP